MSSWFVHRARAAWLFGACLVLAGFVPVALFVGAALLPPPQAAPVLQLLPEMPPEIMTRAENFLQKRRIGWRPSPHHAGLPFAALGLLFMMAGGAIARRQRFVLDAVKARRQDAFRRAQHYRASQRAEPTFGAAMTARPGEEQRAA
jgi:hypothetical protein